MFEEGNFLSTRTLLIFSKKSTSHVTHMNESRHTYEWVMSHIWMSHVTHMNESCHTSSARAPCWSFLKVTTGICMNVALCIPKRYIDAYMRVVISKKRNQKSTWVSCKYTDVSSVYMCIYMYTMPHTWMRHVTHMHHLSPRRADKTNVLQRVAAKSAICVLQCVAACCSELQRVAVKDHVTGTQ